MDEFIADEFWNELRHGCVKQATVYFNFMQRQPAKIRQLVLRAEEGDLNRINWIARISRQKEGVWEAYEAAVAEREARDNPPELPSESPELHWMKLPWPFRRAA